MRQNLVIVGLVVLVSLSAAAQSNYAVLSGTIVDPQSHAVVGAKVELTSSATGAIRRASTNTQGLYELPGLQPGNYQLRVMAPGFGTSAQPLQLEVAQQLAVDIRLQVESQKETVEVSGIPEAIHTNEAAVGEVVEPTSIANLPLNGRMLIDLVLTVPGAHVSHGAQTGNMNPLYWRPGERSASSTRARRRGPPPREALAGRTPRGLSGASRLPIQPPPVSTVINRSEQAPQSSPDGRPVASLFGPAFRPGYTSRSLPGLIRRNALTKHLALSCQNG